MSKTPDFEWESLFDDEEDEAPPPATETEALPPAPESTALPADEFPVLGGDEDEVFDFFLAYEPRERGAGNEEGNSGRTLFRCSHCNLFVAGTLQEHIRSGSGCPDNEELRVRLEESSKRGGAKGGAISRDQGMHSHSFDLTHVLGKGIHGATVEQRMEWWAKAGRKAKRRAGDVEGKCTGCGMLRHTRQGKDRKWCKHTSGSKYCGIFRPLKRKREEDEEDDEEEDEEEE